LPTWKITLEYDGTRYHGWQEQQNARTVAGTIRKAASELLGGSVHLGGSGRTDSGVHALAQVAHLKAGRRLHSSLIRQGLNDLLPADINVLRAEDTESTFDARRDAKARYYLYQISIRRTAFAKQYVWWVKDRLDLDRIGRSLAALKGTHDFAAFCEHRPEQRSSTVEVKQAEMAVDGDLILFRFGARYFLWKMVRRIVGMLVEVGRGRVEVEEFQGLLPIASGRGKQGRLQPVTDERLSAAAHTAPPSGLFLEHVIYDERRDLPGALRPAFHEWLGRQLRQ
jgi:tRNA pseudouridine38-40 synthase